MDDLFGYNIMVSVSLAHKGLYEFADIMNSYLSMEIQNLRGE